MVCSKGQLQPYQISSAYYKNQSKVPRLIGFIPKGNNEIYLNELIREESVWL